MKNILNMKIAVIGGDKEKDYKKFDNVIQSIIEEKQIFLFDVLVMEQGISLGKVWAHNNGAPIVLIREKDPQKAIKRLFKEATYIFFMNDGSQQMKNLIMQYKMTGKHGSVINI